MSSLNTGIHLYISICNLDSIVTSELKKGQSMGRLFYAIDLFSRNIEEYVTKHCGANQVWVEKITGSRIHFVFLKSALLSKEFFGVVNRAFSLINVINHSISSLMSLKDLALNMGADFGLFLDYDIYFEGLSENNSIGYPANYAAKVQSKADPGELLLTKDAHDALDFRTYLTEATEVKKERGILAGTIYEGKTYYSLTSDKWNRLAPSKEELMEEKESIGSFEKLLNQYSPNNQTVFDGSSFAKSTRPGSIILKESSVLYCDIRGFTKKFAKDGSNLLSMSQVAIKSLQKMYDCTSQKSLTHIQFQGDRELSIENNGIDNAFACAFEMLSVFEKHFSQSLGYADMAIGIGIGFGSFYYAKVGARSSKDPLLLGLPVSLADTAEDKYAANRNSIAIHKDGFDKIMANSNAITKAVATDLFYKKDDFYVLKPEKTSIDYINEVSKANSEYSHLEQRNDKANPWRP